jgi:uncharacterized protein (DUF1330 family)
VSATCIFDIYEVSDSKMMEEYRKMVGKTVEEYGGRYLLVGGDVEVIEGEWSPTYPVIIQFESIEAAHEWFNSPEYENPKSIRLAASKSNVVFIGD